MTTATATVQSKPTETDVQAVEKPGDVAVGSQARRLSRQSKERRDVALDRGRQTYRRAIDAQQARCRG